jgi:hypothetical protein
VFEQTHQTETAPATEAGNRVRRPGIKLIARICGGLGNQLFIYAAGRALATRMGARLELDTISGYANDHLYRREYLLDQFAITASSASAWDCFPGRLGRWRESLAIRLSRAGVAQDWWQFVDERTARASLRARKLYLRGYWQSEGYFQVIADEVRREFRLTAPLPAQTQVELSRIRAEGAPVALGVRRFEEVPAKDRRFVVDIEFYHRALARLAACAPQAHVFIFTEDVEWTKAELQCQLPHTYVAHKPGNRRAYEDLALMQACKLFIIGNSSYHWWGAWLGNDPGKIVFVPRNVPANCPDLFPANWQRL